MPNPFFNALCGGKQPNIMQMLNQLKANPIQFLQRAGFNVPANLNSPNGIIQHLMNSGQISQQNYEKARQMAAQFKR